MKTQSLRNSWFFSPSKVTAVLLFAVTTVIAAADPDGVDFDAVQLQRTFAHAKDFSLVTSVREIPADGQRILKHLSSITDPSTPVLADAGMDWSVSDVVRTGVPWGQHRFTVANDQLLAIVFVSGGLTIHYRIILAPRSSDSYCIFDAGTLSETSFRIRDIQWVLDPDKRDFEPETPKCDPQKM